MPRGMSLACAQMNHKRKRPKNRRGGCLMCKPQKQNHAKASVKLKRADRRRALRADLAEVNRAIISCGGGPALEALLSEKLSIVRQLRILER